VGRASSSPTSSFARHGRIDVAELYKDPERSAYGDVNWGAIVSFVVGGWWRAGSVEDGLVAGAAGGRSRPSCSPAADLSWLVGIVVAGRAST